MDEVDAISATTLSSAAIQVALLDRLKSLGVLSDQDEREILGQALLLIEESKSRSEATDRVYTAARELIRARL